MAGVAVTIDGRVEVELGAINCSALREACAAHAASPLAISPNASHVSPRCNRMRARPKCSTGYTRQESMSSHAPDQISRRSWRAAVISLLIAASATISAALLIAVQGQAANAPRIFNQLDSGWMVRSGRVETDRLVLRPAASSTGLALHPIDSSTFTLQARVTLAPAQGAAGLIVQADDPDHFSAFLISNDGYFRVSDYRNGAWIDRAAWRAWPHLHRAGRRWIG